MDKTYKAFKAVTNSLSLIYIASEYSKLSEAYIRVERFLETAENNTQRQKKI